MLLCTTVVWRGHQDHIALPLMRAFLVKMRHVFYERMPKSTLATQNKPRQRFLLRPKLLLGEDRQTGLRVALNRRDSIILKIIRGDQACSAISFPSFEPLICNIRAVLLEIPIPYSASAVKPKIQHFPRN